MKRIAIFMHYDNENQIAPFVMTYVQALSAVVSETIFISNSSLSESEQNKVMPFVSRVLLRENRGMDFGAWKEAIENIGWERLLMFDELVLANDSCFAPLFPLEEMFIQMSAQKCDFWGVTEHLAATTGSGNLLTHLQSYFLVFKRKAMEAPVFQSFWRDMRLDHDEYDVIVNQLEAKMTMALTEEGLRHGVYISEEKLYRDSPFGAWRNSRFFNRTIWNWCGLLKQRSPFLKRKAIPYHVERVSKLIRIGYGRGVTQTCFRQTFYWTQCIRDTGSNYDLDALIQQVHKDSGHSFAELEQYRTALKIKYYVWAPYRSFKKIRHALRKK